MRSTPRRPSKMRIRRLAEPWLLVLGVPALAACARHDGPSAVNSPRLQSVAFETRSEIDVGADGVADATLADLDRDGRLDLAVTTLDGHLQVLLGQNGGTFAVGRSLPAPGLALQVAAADVDQDLDVDLAVLRTDDDVVDLWSNDGNANFTLAASLSVPSGANGMAVGDCDGDGAPEVLLSHFGAAAISVLDNGPSHWVTAAPILLPNGVSAGGVWIGDLDGDGVDEVLATDNAGGRMFMLRAGAGGLMQVVDQHAVGPQPLTITSGDLGGDGVPDVLVSCSGSGELAAFTMSAGTLVAGPVLQVGGTPAWSAVADVTADGVPDVVTCVLGEPYVALAPGRAGGGFGPVRGLAATGLPFRPLVADVDGDGHPDLLASGGGTRVVNLWRGTASGLQGARSHTPAIANPEVVAATDLDGDGRAEVAVAGIDTTEILVLQAAGQAVAELSLLQRIDVGASVLGVVADDLDGDGRIDFAVQTRSGVVLFENRSSPGQVAFAPLSAPAAIVVPGLGPFDLAAADMNGDGWRDLVVSDVWAQTVSVTLATGPHFAYEPAPHTVAVPGVPGGLVVSDFDGDGVPDVAVTRNEAAMVRVLHNDGTGALQTWLDVPVGAGPSYAEPTDFDGDGRIDVVVSNSVTDEVTVLLTRDSGFSTEIVPVGAIPTALRIADLDHDGAPDLVVASLRGGDVHVVMGSGNGGFGANFRFPATYRASSAALADLDADGEPDLVLASLRAQRIDVYRNVSH